MKRIALTAALVLATACYDPADEYRNGLPTADAVRINVPETASGALTSTPGVSRSALEGETSDMYRLTRGATTLVNGGVIVVLGLLKAITDHRPTSLDGNEAVWGPHTPALSLLTWRLTVTRHENQHFTYSLDAKHKSEPDESFVPVLSGAHDVAVAARGQAREGYGSGTFLLDWSARATLPEHDDNLGSATVTYSRVDDSSPVTVDVAFDQVRDHESGELIDATYSFSKTPGASGEFTFVTRKNIDEGLDRTALETLAIKSRWLDSGAGRSDVSASGGDLLEPQTASECWDELFISQYLNLTWDPSKNYGDEATDCAFATASYPNL